MPAFIALYRGVNVGGRHAVKMDELRALHERLGHTSVRNYVQSGNIVFTAKGTAKSITRRLATAFEAEFNFASRVIVVEAAHWHALVAANPFAKPAAADPKSVHLAICEGAPDRAALAALLAKTGGRETFKIERHAIYLHAPDGFGTSKFAAGMERAAGVPMTVRNWRTVEAIDQLAQATM
jgi:uncharacterized protein (DUF1697 family)